MKAKNIAIATSIGLAAISAVYGIVKLVQADYARNQAMLDTSNTPITATVLAEQYANRLVAVEKWDGLVSYSNPTTTLDSKYTLKLQTDDGRIIGLTIKDFRDVTKESLDILIQGAEEVGLEKATRIQFPQGNLKGHKGYIERFFGETDFKTKSHSGTKYAHRIKILHN